MYRYLFILSLLISFHSYSQDQLDLIDIQHYTLYLNVSDDSDTIEVKELVELNYLKNADRFYLDLASVKEGKGMRVTHVVGGEDGDLKFKHEDDKLWIYPESMTAGESESMIIRYLGVPETGLIIGKNKFGDRTFFGDNWPNRAHHWFACVDHPADKATIKFTVTAPKKYDCIATGEFLGKDKNKNGTITHLYQSDILLPTKVMVIGLAEFDVQKLKNKHDFKHDIWVYPQDAKKGFANLEVAKEIIDFFIDNLGYYPFEKLSNVQSTTQFGGMENAGNIFYDENAFVNEERIESLAAHEIAHQWFGNSASEADWKHVWLSEGFAVYMTNLYWEHKYGTDAMNERLIGEREKVFRFSKHYNHPVVDTTYESLMDLLNPHSYQKGGWVLHMLRNEVGDSLFWKGVRTYYEKYEYSNATTNDFQKVMETISGKDLNLFFDQWLRESQHPTLKTVFNTKDGIDILTVYQRQNTHVYDFNLEIEFTYDDGSTEIKSYHINQKKLSIQLPKNKTIASYRFDPNVKLLFELLKE